MKKLSLLLMFLISAWTAQAQFIQYYEMTFKDANGNLWPSNLTLEVTNTDSSTNGQAFYDMAYSGYYGGNTGTYRIIDSVTIPASYTGNQISFSVNVCGTTVQFDTVLSQNSTIAHVFTLPCTYTCDASFNYGIDMFSYLSMSSTDVNSAHAWYLDNVLISNSRTHGQYITGAGNHLLAHTVKQGSYCQDSSVQMIFVDSSCTTNLDYNVMSNNNVEFIANTWPAGRNCQLNFGDGNMQNFTSSAVDTIYHQYAAANTYTAYLTIFGQGCIDSTFRTFNTVTQNCDASFTKTWLSPFQFRLTRNDSSVGTSEWVISGPGINSTVTGHNITVTLPGAGNFGFRCNVLVNNVQACYTTQSTVLNNCGKVGFPAGYHGQVIFPTSFMTAYDSAKVYRIAYDSVNQTLTALDSLVIYNQDSGWFYFEDCDYNQRNLFKAALMPGSSLYSSYLPTYADSAVLWSAAREFNPNNNFGIQIHMIAGTNPGGPGFIGGYINQGANKNGAGLDGIQVTLFTATDQPVAFATTFNAGRYEFSNLALGSYKVLVEIPGKTSSIHYVTLSQAKQSADDLNFEVNSTDISVLNSAFAVRANLFKAYPNPVAEKLTIESTLGEELTFVRVMDIQGKVRVVQMRQAGPDKLELDLGGLESGVYLIEAGNDQLISRLRIIKQ
ncbi:MAG: T9SS type A sorting domain-containing protein [Bacteroidetes bacterium]|nr:MAG: T9SS type A sorting domain-containing protein [Bacteroidota bacterium]